MRKILCFIVAFGLLTGLTVTAFALEMETTASTTAPATEATTEATTEPVAMVTEAPTEAPTEALTAASTEAPAPSSEAPAVSSEPPTQPSETSAPTEPSVSSEPTASTEPTEPSTSTEPSAPSEPTAPTEPSVPQFPTLLEIDTENTYEGMDGPYEDGYAPRVENGVAHLVLPLLPTGEIYQDQIKASLSLSGAPFVLTTYEKTFSLETVTPQDSTEPVELFLIRFDVSLTDDRTNGVYPVTVKLSGFDAKGGSIGGSYTLYVTVTDGKSGTPTQPAQEKPTAEPVIYISKTVISPEEVMAGEEFTLTLTLQNSLTTKSVRNMLVTVDTGNSQISLLEDGNIFPIEKIAAGGTATLTIRLRADASTPAGKYPVNFSFQYDSSKTLNLSSSGSTTVEIHQPANMELVMPRFPESVTVGETVPMSLQVMNMGRAPMYNVRCVVSGFGFAPSNTGYIGTMNAGSSSTTKVELYIIALNASQGNENGSQYGGTTGTVTLYYEDESGEEFQQETQFETELKRPIAQLPQVDNTQEEEEQAAISWWVSIVIMGGVILAVVIIGIIVSKKKKRGGAYL